MHFYDCICITSASYDTCDPAVLFSLGSIAEMFMHVQAVDTQAVSLLPHGLGTRIVVTQLFCLVSSCPYRKDGCFVNELATMAEVFNQFLKSCYGFVFCEDLRHFL